MARRLLVAHRAGPYYVDDSHGDYLTIRAKDDDQTLAHVREDYIDADGVETFTDEARATARLFAASPDLLEALQKMNLGECLHSGGNALPRGRCDCRPCDNARIRDAALAKLKKSRLR